MRINGRKMFILLLFFALFMLGGRFHDIGLSGGFDYVPSPQLVRPTSDEVDMTGQTEFEFKWLREIGRYHGKEYYDFRLYKGYPMLESTLMFKRALPVSASSVKVDAKMFEEGQVYTWSLRHVCGATKSDRSHVSFKVVKK